MAEHSLRNGSISPSECLRLKHTYIFHLLFDTTHDRNLSRQDFSKLQKMLCDIRSQTGAREATRALETRLGAVWAGLIKSTKDYRRNALQKHLSLPEWLEYWDDFVRAARKLQRKWPETSENGRVDFRWHSDFLDLIFDVMDANGDGVIDKGEHSSFLTTFGVPSPVCEDAMHKLTLDGSDVTKARFSDLWFQFMTCTDLAHPGNFLFGDPFRAASDGPC